MEYQNGDKVVVPGCGVGRVSSKTMVPVGGQSIETIEIHLRNQDGRVWIPLDRLLDQGIRPVMSPTRFKELKEIIRAEEPPKRRRHWNQRRRRYTDMLDSGQPSSIAKLIGELSAVRSQKKKGLSFTEKRMLRKAWRLLTAEVAMARGVPREQVIAELSQIVEAPRNA